MLVEKVNQKLRSNERENFRIYLTQLQIVYTKISINYRVFDSAFGAQIIMKNGTDTLAL